MHSAFSNHATWKTLSVFLTCGLFFLLLLAGCRDDDLDPLEDRGSLTHIPFDTMGLVIETPDFFPKVEAPADNPTTVQGVELGRMLFFDPILSADSTISCASCHQPELSFTDGLAVSKGINGQEGIRSAPSLLNVGLHRDAPFFWDGRAPSLESQARDPITNPIEMGNTWEQVEADLRNHPTYPQLFRKAFNIIHKDQITRELITMAIAQFERTLVSSGSSAYDRYDRNEFALSDEALDGFNLFFDEVLPDAECGHCHTVNLFTNNAFFNVGLDDVESVRDYEDVGRGGVTGDLADFGKFKTPTLRNITLTAPYMHDGRFATLEEVLDHYDSGGHRPIRIEDNVDPLIAPQGLSEQDKRNIIAFLEALTDTAFINNPAFQNPFE